MKRRDVLKVMAASSLVGCGGDNLLTGSPAGPMGPSDPGTGMPIASNEFEQALPQPGFEPVGFFLVLAPAGTPKDVLAKVSGGIARAVKSSDLSAKWRDLGLEAVGSTPEELGAEMKTLAETMDRAIKAAKIKLDN